MTSAAAGTLYVRRRVRRVLPKLMIGGAVLAAAAAAAAAVAGIGVLGAGAGATAWYRHRSKAVAPSNGWKPQPAPVGSSFGGSSARETSSQPASE